MKKVNNIKVRSNFNRDNMISRIESLAKTLNNLGVASVTYNGKDYDTDIYSDWMLGDIYDSDILSDVDIDGLDNTFTDAYFKLAAPSIMSAMYKKLKDDSSIDNALFIDPYDYDDANVADAVRKYYYPLYRFVNMIRSID